MSTHSSANAAPRRTHGIMARLTRLAAGVLLVTLVAAAFTALSQATVSEASVPTHNCIHDELQQRVIQSVARQRLSSQVISPVGLPYVKAAEGASASGQSSGTSEDIIESMDDSTTDSEPTTAAPTTTTKEPLADSSSPNATRAAEWSNFRITVSAEDLTDPAYHCATVGQVINNRVGASVTCTAADIMTDAKRDILMNYLIPQALQMHQDRLQVRQVQGAWVVTGVDGRICGAFKKPEEHLTAGVNNTDFVIYVGSVPARTGVLAWATTCQVFSDDHPAVGVINIPAAYIAERYDQYMIHTVTHEIAHALGFSGTFFTYTGIGQRATGVRGKDYAVPVINSTTVVEKARMHYGCDAAEYMELEDAGGSGTMGSHWKIRNAQDELMAGVAGVGYYTNLTMSGFEDLGYYKANYSMAETMAWGRNAGCTFLNDKCVIDNVTQFPSMYCDTDERVFRCQPARLNLGTCGLATYSQDLPTYFQYFTVPSVGGRSAYYDYCPYIGRYAAGKCTQDEADATSVFLAFNTFSMSSRCLDGNFTPKDNGGSPIDEYYGMCTRLTCDPATQNYSIYVRGSSGYVNCTPGETMDLSTISDAFEEGGYITCPPYMEVCQSNVQAIRDFEYGPTTTTSTTTTTTTTTTAAPTTTSTTTTTTAAPTTTTSTAAPTTTTTSTTATPTSTGEPSTTTTTTTEPTTSTSTTAPSSTTTTAAPSGGRGNAAASLCSPRVVVAALLSMVLAVVAV